MLQHRHAAHRRARLALAAALAVPGVVAVSVAASHHEAHALTAPQLVADVNTDGEGSSPGSFALAGSKLFFAADDGVHGRELWVSDNAAAPTMAADINPSGASNPGPLFTTNAGVVYFAASDGQTGTELWRSDGTGAGTYRVADIQSGSGSSRPEGFVSYAGFVYFNASTSGSGSSGAELWRTDGTAAGTMLAADLDAGAGSSDPQELTVVDHGAGDRRLWMRADASGSFNSELVVYDAPEGATADPPVVLLPEGNPSYLTAFDGDLYTVSGSALRTLQRVERTAVGPPATYAAASLGGSSPQQLVAMGGDLYLSNGATTTGDQELHVLDGNTIELVKDINVGAANASPNDFIASGGYLYFAASDGIAHGEELWRSDGTEAGTVMVADIAAGAVASHPAPIAANAGAVFFTADDQLTGRELWFARASDGAAFQVEDLFPGETGAFPVGGELLGTHLYIAGDDRVHGDEIMRVDVSAPLVEGATDISLFADLAAGTGSSEPYYPAAVGTRVMFTAKTYELGHEGWLFDPAARTATLLADFEAGNLSGWPSEATALDDVTVFTASAGGMTELWVTDGTPAGTSAIDIDTGSEASPYDVVRAGDYVYFNAEHSAYGRELWRSDGTAAGTMLLVDGAAGTDDGNPGQLTPFGDRLLFELDGALWITDGTAAATHPVISGAGAPAEVGEIAANPAWAAFSAASPSSPADDALWITDGTPVGTFAIESTPTANPRSPWEISMSGSIGYFSAYDGGNVRAWATDGTPDGTHPLTIAPTEPYGDEYGGFAGGGAVFGAYDDDYELWVTDGTLAGTREVDIPNGPLTQLPYEFTSHNGWAYFAASEAAHGNELWRTNGVTTERVTDLAPGPADGLPFGNEHVTAIGNDVYFVGDDGTTGDELWVLADVPAAPTSVVATAGVESVDVAWSASTASPLAPVIEYTATAAPGGATCTTSATTCTIAALAPGVAYTFIVVARSSAGPSAASTPSSPAVPLGAGGGSGTAPLTPIEPARYLDTRAEPTFDGQQTGVGRQPAGAVLRVPIAGRGSVPAAATGVVANLTVVSPDAAGHATLFPCTPQPPQASHLNYLPGEVVADNAVVRLDATGALCVYTRAAADYVLDVNGFVPDGSSFVGVDPARYLDTRTEPAATTFDGAHLGGGAVPAEQVVEVAIAGRGAIPADAAAAFVTVTAVAPAGPGYLALYPCGARPHASSVNYSAGQVVPNGAVVELSSGGTLCIFTKAAAHILVDVAGYLPAGTDGLHAMAPERLVDTRPSGPTVDGVNSGAPGRLGDGQSIEIQVAGRGSIPSGATAALLNIGLVGPDKPGYATLYPCGTRPTASNVNAIVPGSVRANNALTKLSPAGTVCVYAKSASDVILDATGWLT